MGKYCFGIDIGGTFVKCGLFTVEGELLESWEIPTRRENKGSNVPGDIAQAIHGKMKERAIQFEDIIGVGAGVPGPVTQDGKVEKCVNLGWENYDINGELGKLIGLPVVSANDANVAALGEMWKGGGRGYDDVIMVTLGTGVGGGVILGGKMLSGSTGAAGEIGHIIVNTEEKDVCGCGSCGHLEQYASATGIVRVAKKALEDEAIETKLRNIADLSAKDIFDYAKEGDHLACELVEVLGRYLGIALSYVSAVVDPQVFVIGGGVSKAGQILIDVVSKHYNSENVLEAHRGKEFRLAELGNDAGMYGCAQLVLANLK